MVEALLDLGLTVTLSDSHVTVNVPEFIEFLRAYYRACALMSRTNEGRFLRMASFVSVLYGDRWYQTKIWFDIEARGVRYGSVG